MRRRHEILVVASVVALVAALRLAPVLAQEPAQARVLTVLDRQGNVVATVGERAMYSDPVFSPDGTRLAVVKRDLESGTQDLWVLDIATARGTRITSTQRREAGAHGHMVSRRHPVGVCGLSRRL